MFLCVFITLFVFVCDQYSLYKLLGVNESLHADMFGNKGTFFLIYTTKAQESLRQACVFFVFKRKEGIRCISAAPVFRKELVFMLGCRF